MPCWLHMTVPRTFRRSAAIPKAVVLHTAEVPPADIELIDGVPVTKALRTLIDVASAGEIPLPDLKLAFAEAARLGNITRAAILAAKMDAARRHILRILLGQKVSADTRLPKAHIARRLKITSARSAKASSRSQATIGLAETNNLRSIRVPARPKSVTVEEWKKPL